VVTLNEAFPSKHLKAADVPEPVVATIKLAELERMKDFSGKEVTKVVIYFNKKLKPLPLNRTNFESIMDICGSGNSEDFPGTKVEVYATKTSMNGQIKDCVRIRAPGAAGKPKKAAADGDDKPPYDDEIPFA
jgi:hypothetical protein